MCIYIYTHVNIYICNYLYIKIIIYLNVSYIDIKDILLNAYIYIQFNRILLEFVGGHMLASTFIYTKFGEVRDLQLSPGYHYIVLLYYHHQQRRHKRAQLGLLCGAPAAYPSALSVACSRHPTAGSLIKAVCAGPLKPCPGHFFCEHQPQVSACRRYDATDGSFG